MSKIRVTKIFHFEMAHALWNYDGACRNIHGHSYVLFVTLIGTPVNDINNPKNGMVVDFGDIKKIVKDNIVKEFDHALVISKFGDYHKINPLEQMFGKVKVVDYQPTVENLLIHFSGLIKSSLPENIRLFSVKLQETGSSYAEWFADDNS
jgi:6-pyruvoyltetrahydropterin/6-carboxytetrahydropterin synthase